MGPPALSATLLVLALCCVPEVCQGQADVSTGYRLPTEQEFLVIAPRKVRPEQIFEMHVTLFRMHYADLTVRAVLSQDGEEYASGTVIFYDKGTKSMQLAVPLTVKPGDHMLKVEGLASGQTGRPVFRNETKLEFETKFVSLFIHTDAPVYYPPQTVKYRIVGVTQYLKPVSGSMTIYIRDANGIRVRRWLQEQLNFGMHEGQFDLSYPVATGTWTIEVDAFGHIYEQTFEVIFFWPSERIFHVNVTTPMNIFDTEWGVAGSIYGEHSLGGLGSWGNATVGLTVVDENGQTLSGQINKTIGYMKGTVPFGFNMQEIRDMWGDVAGKELHFKGWIHDWMWLNTQNGTSVTKVLKDGVTLKYLGRKLRTFKPLTPITVYFAVSRSDGSPYTGFFNRQVFLQRVHEGQGSRSEPEEKRLIPDDGIIRYSFTPGEYDEKIRAIAWHPDSGSKVEVQLYRYFSQSGKYLSVTTQTDTPTTNEYMIFTVRINFYVPEVNYLIEAGGNILLGSTLVMNTRQRTFSIAVSREMSPTAKLVAYCVVDREILMDSLAFFVKDSHLSQASMHINLGKDFTLDSLEMVVKGSAGGFVGIHGHDWEWYRRGAATFITEEDVIYELLSYDSPADGPAFQTWYHDDGRWEEISFFPTPTTGMDTLSNLEVSGLVALSDMNMTVKQEYTSCNKTLGYGLCPNGQCYELSKKCDGYPDCQDGYDEVTCPPNPEEMWHRRPPEIKNLHTMPRYFDPGWVWMWQVSYIKPNGQVEIHVDMPEFTDATIMSGFVLHPDEGLSLFRQPVEYDTTRVFLMYSEAPAVICRGEQVGIRLAMMNNWDQNQEILLMMHGGDNYRFVRVEEFGIVSSYTPRLVSGDIQTMVYMQAGEQKYMFMPIIPIVEEGVLNIKITAYSQVRTDTEEVEIEVVYDGTAMDEFIPYILDLVNKGSQLIPDFDTMIPERFVVPGQRDMLYIPSSNKAYMQIHGDMVLPGLIQPELSSFNIEGAVPPYTADSMMFDYAINLITINYLHTVNALEPEDLNRALEMMETILMRQYAYMQPDGSMKMFRRNSEPCVWLTAFVLKYLHASLVSQWVEELYVPVEVLNRMALWLTKQQDESGAFPEPSGVYYDINYVPTVVDDEGVTQEWHIPVTANVVITLSLATRLTGDVKALADEAKQKGADYLASKYLHISDPFQLAITAYALEVARHSEKDNAYIKLRSINRTSEFIYWASTDIVANNVRIVDTIPIMESREDYENLQNSVMATSYALLLYLYRNQLAESVPIMKWLVGQHKTFNYWSSTQDTLIALEALAEFSFRQTNRDFYRMTLTIGGAGQAWGPNVLHLNNSNFAQMHELVMENAFGEIRASAQGTGYAYLSMISFRNVEKGYQVLDLAPGYPTYNMEITELSFTGRNASFMHMTFCGSWIRPDLNHESTMTLVEVIIPTGFMVTRDTIEGLYVAGIPGLRRVRFADQALVFFFETITKDRLCVSFQADRWYPVANVSISHSIEFRNYGEEGISIQTAWDSYTLFHLHICQVCGSFQCPYCQFYNHAQSTVAPPTGITILAAILMTMLVMNMLRVHDRGFL